jgi:transcriptional regulator with XRE-family HTH domain
MHRRRPSADQFVRELVGRNVTRARQEAGLSQRQLADSVGTVRTQVSLWENGRRQPSAHFLIAIAGATGHADDLGWFYNEHGELAAAAAAP